MTQQLLSVTDARERVLKVAHGPLGTERISVERSLDRVLAEDLFAQDDVPPFGSSAMDGYAVLDGSAGQSLRVVGESRAGMPYTGSISSGEAIRISTGAAVPSQAGTVIRQEDVAVHEDVIDTLAAAAAGQNIRNAGADMHRGSLVLPAGTVISPRALGAAVAAGAGMVTVARAPRVVVLCTGDELRAPGEPLGPGEIHNSNGPMLTALAARCGAVVEPVLRLADSLGATEASLRDALNRADLLIITGGVSVGPHDHVRPALSKVGVDQHFWGVALQPGKPTWFGSRGEQLVFGLPGNPVSAIVTFTLFARAALRALQAPARIAVPMLPPSSGGAVRRNPSRERAICVRLALGAQATVATPTGPQESHLITSLLHADALAMIPAARVNCPRVRR